MAHIFITGSSDGLGLLAAQRLVKNGHSVVLHARNASRAKDATSVCPSASNVLIGDLSSIEETKKLAEEANKLGTFDCVIHNAGLYMGPFRKTEDGLPALTAVNTIAPYILTCLMNRPKRLVFVSSELHSGGDGTLKDVLWKERGEKGYTGMQAYGDSKLHNIMFAKAFARNWADVKCNALDPGWVPTKMGGAGAMGSLEKAVETYVFLAEGTEEVNGKYFSPGKREGRSKAVADDIRVQERLLGICEEVSGVKIPD